MGSVLRVLNVFRFLLSLLVFSELWKSTFSSSTLPYWFTYVVLFMCCLEPHGFTSGFTQLQPSLCPQQHGRTIQHGVECRTLTKSGRDCSRTTSTCHGVSCHVRWFNGFKTPTAPRIQSRLLWGQTYKIVKHTNSYKFSISPESHFKVTRHPALHMTQQHLTAHPLRISLNPTAHYCVFHLFLWSSLASSFPATDSLTPWRVVPLSKLSH